MCEQDVFASRLSYFACHDTVSYYDTTHTSLFINYHATSDFCLGGMHNTSYDTLIVTSLRTLITGSAWLSVMSRPVRTMACFLLVVIFSAA
jgi:hypothetical protein